MASTTETISLQAPTTPPAQPSQAPAPAPLQYPPQPYQQPQGQYPPQPYQQPQGQYPPQPYQQPGQMQQPYQQPQINLVVNTQANAVAQAAPSVILVKQKSVFVAFLLTFFFGPFGLFYVTIPGAIIFLLVTLVLTVITAGVFGILAWIISMIWAIVAASNYNKNITVIR